jgi:hypothetical protein
VELRSERRWIVIDGGASNKTASGFATQREVTTVATTGDPEVSTAVGPSSEARIAVGPSLVLRHEHDGRDFVFV